MRSLLLAIAPLLAILPILPTLAASPALAQEPPAPGVVPAEPAADARAWTKSQNNRVGLEVDFWSARTELTFFDTTIGINYLGLPITPVAQIELIDKIYLDVELPLGLGFLSVDSSEPDAGGGDDDGGGGFLLGNPTLGAHYADSYNEQIAFFFGGSVSIPTIHGIDSNDNDDEDRVAALAAVAPTRAAYDLHRFVPEAIPIRARGGAEIRILPWLYYRGDLAPVMYIPTGGQDVEFLIEQSNEIEARTPTGLGGGLRLQEVFTLTEGDDIQTALEPFVSYEPAPAGVYARLGLLMALDEELGFAFDQGKVLTARLAGGYKF